MVPNFLPSHRTTARSLVWAVSLRKIGSLLQAIVHMRAILQNKNDSWRVAVVFAVVHRNNHGKKGEKNVVARLFSGLEQLRMKGGGKLFLNCWTYYSTKNGTRCQELLKKAISNREDDVTTREKDKKKRQRESCCRFKRTFSDDCEKGGEKTPSS